jgi:hypothetical protein
MKQVFTTALALALSTTAALAFSFPAHEQNGWRDTGCDKAANVEIKNAAGKVLYLNNPTCPSPSVGGPNILDVIAELFPADEAETPAD